MAKTIGGDPLRPRAAWEREPIVLTSANVNADGEQPVRRVPGPKIIGGDPLRPRGHWEQEPIVLTSATGNADDS